MPAQRHQGGLPAGSVAAAYDEVQAGSDRDGDVRALGVESALKTRLLFAGTGLDAHRQMHAPVLRVGLAAIGHVIEKLIRPV